MTTAEKAQLYDNYIYESDKIQREISRLKSQYVTNIPVEIEREIAAKQRRITEIVAKVESLF